MYDVLDALSHASKSVSFLLNRNLEIPPVPIKTIKKQDGSEVAQSKDEQLPNGFNLPNKNVKVFEIWKIFLEENEDEIDEAYVVIGAEYSIDGYKGGKWKDVKYRGFYNTVQEAVNEANGYLR